jgi:tetratricopeptide (TPR) repeat protein
MLRLCLPLLLAAHLAAPALGHAQGGAEAQRARAEELLDAEDYEAALEVLDRLVGKRTKDAEALLLRSTARFMTGDLPGGSADLERALELDPELRQGWLNLGGLRMSQQRYQDAADAFLRARELDPSSPENDLNVGAALVLAGDLQVAAGHFERYLAETPTPVEGHYLVATNYALAGYASLALQHLEQAVRLDSRIRLRLRPDPVFDDLRNDERFRALLETDTYQPAAGALRASQSFETPYNPADGRLVTAVVDALDRLGISFDRRVEVASTWAVVWAEARIKLSNGPDGKGRVELTAPPDRFTPQEWAQHARSILEQIEWELAPKLPALGD